MLPAWQDVWWSEFGNQARQYLCAVRDGDDVIGIAPLMLKDNRAFFIGSPDTCDYMDFVVAPDKEREFFITLIDGLLQEGVASLELLSVRADSTVLTSLAKVAPEKGSEFHCHSVDVSLELDLPATWDEYLRLLSGKQRHEVRRRLRRLEEAGDIGYHVIEDAGAIREYMGTFLKLFRESREDKAEFMTTQMESFFLAMTEAMAEAKLLHLGSLNIDASPAAMVMCFDYKDTVYLYNSGYDPRYSSLSVGLLSKVLCIQDSIKRDRKRFDFLKGAEEYKYRWGGTEVPLYNCKVVFG